MGALSKSAKVARRPTSVLTPAPVLTPPQSEGVEVEIDMSAGGWPVPVVPDPSDIQPPTSKPIAIRIAILRKAGEQRSHKGNHYYSTMVVIPKPILAVTGIGVGDSVLIMGWPDGTIVIKKAGEGG